MAYKVSPAKQKAFDKTWKQRFDNLSSDVATHKVKGGYYTKNGLGMITWHEGANQRLVELNDASGEAWKKIKKER